MLRLSDYKKKIYNIGLHDHVHNLWKCDYKLRYFFYQEFEIWIGTGDPPTIYILYIYATIRIVYIFFVRFNFASAICLNVHMH